MAAKMLCAYYDQSCDSRQLFADLKIAADPQFEKHLNKYPVIYLDVSDFVTRFRDDSNGHLRELATPHVQGGHVTIAIPSIILVALRSGKKMIR